MAKSLKEKEERGKKKKNVVRSQELEGAKKKLVPENGLDKNSGNDPLNKKKVSIQIKKLAKPQSSKSDHMAKNQNLQPKQRQKSCGERMKAFMLRLDQVMHIRFFF